MQNSEYHIYIVTRDSDNRILSYRLSEGAKPSAVADIPAGYSEHCEAPASVTSLATLEEQNAYIETHRLAFSVQQIDCSNATEVTPTTWTYDPIIGIAKI